MSKWIPEMFFRGWASVEMFFIVSGFVISRGLIPEIEVAFALNDSRARRDHLSFVLKSFFIGRLCKLALPAIFWVVAYFFLFDNIIAPGNGIGWQNFWREALSIVLWVYNLVALTLPKFYFGWFWSLAIEDQFYLVYPFILVLFKTKKERLIVFLGYFLFVTFILRPVVFPAGTENWPKYRIFSPLKFDTIFLGCALFLAQDHAAFKFLARWCRTYRLTTGIIVGSLVLLMFWISFAFDGQPLIAHPLVNLVVLALLIIAVSDTGILRFNGTIGKINRWIYSRSYAIYLCHIPSFGLAQALQIYYDRGHSPLTGLFKAFAVGSTAILLVVVFAEMTYSLLEMPLVLWSKRYVAKLTAPTSVAIQPEPLSVAP